MLFHAMDDATDDVRHSLTYGLALSDLGVPVEMHFYAAGGHAFGLRPTFARTTTEWPVLAENGCVVSGYWESPVNKADGFEETRIADGEQNRVV